MKPLVAVLAVLLAAGPASAQFFAGPVVPGPPFVFGHVGPRIIVSGTLGGPFGFPRPFGYGGWHHGGQIITITTITPPPVIVVPVIPLWAIPRDSDMPPVPFRPPQRQPQPRQAPPAAPKPAPAPPAAPVLPMPARVDEAERLVTAGRTAFAAGEYGRAAERFARAAELKPEHPLAKFLHAQALFAQSRYEQALTALEAAFRAHPIGPGKAFAVRSLYGNQAAELDAEMGQLRGALMRFPDDAVLQFLLGYELWFDRHRDEARPLLHRAAPRLPLPRPFERFINGLDGPVVKQ